MQNKWLFWRSEVPDDIIGHILKKAQQAEIDRGEVFSGDGNDVRSSRVGWLTGDLELQLLLYRYVDLANREWGFNVWNQADIQYTEYHASEDGHYTWHHDVNFLSDRHRKISVTLQLSSPLDYEGGDFEFAEQESPDFSAKEKGTVLVFPSFYHHRVTQVTKGTRKSLVAWFEGPVWR